MEIVILYNHYPKNIKIAEITIPEDTQRCVNVDSTLKFGRDVVQPIFNQSRLPGSLGLTVNVDSTLNQR